MENINAVVFESIESKAKLYNKPMTVVKYAAPATKVHVIDNTVNATTYEKMIDAGKGGPMHRIAFLEKQVENLLERINELEDVVNRILLAE
jgi:hypothetical protein